MKIGAGRAGLIVVLSAWVSFTSLLIYGGIEITNQASEAIVNAPTFIAQPISVRLNGTATDLSVPSWRWLKTGRPWSYVSSNQPIDINFVPELTELSVAHGDWLEDKRIQPLVNEQLSPLAEAAKNAGLPIIITSAYRSAVDQQKLINEMALQHGTQYSHDYVAQPGRSEHQLGLAVDFSSFSAACQADFAQCQLKKETANWLAEHAHEYGFIVRYPEGKQHITGVAPESWHLRYVGHKMAALIKQSGLTFDEIYQQLEAARRKFVENS